MTRSVRFASASASFASGSQQRGATMLPSHADGWSYNPAGIGSDTEIDQSVTDIDTPESERADGNLRCERNAGRWRRCVRTIEGHAPMVEAGGGPPVSGAPCPARVR